MKIKHFKSYSQNWLIILFLISTISALWTLKASIIAQDFNCLGQPATKVGTNQSDNIQGTAGNDVIVALGGNDKIFGLGGDDIICGGNGLDEIHGGDGIDNLDGGSNTDRCLNGETTTSCEQFSGLKEIKSKSNRIEVNGQREDNFETMLIFEGKSAEKNYQNSSMLVRMSSYIHSLRLMLISVFFASSAYAQFSPTPFIDFEYFYDGVGNVESIIDHIDSSNSCTMQYDSLDRLTVSDGPWGVGSFGYDSIGNRTSKDINGENITYTYGSSDNRLGGVTHDAKGNIIDDGTFTYTYDSENRLIQVTNGTDVITYVYDGDGRRISQTIDGETTFFGYGVGLNALTEFSGSGVPKFDYIYAGSRNIARINFDAAGVPVSKTFYHGDHLGSTIGLTDQETTVVWDRMYLPYGETFTGSGGIQNTHQYTAKELDEDTGLYYYGARYYKPSIGRFMSVDPVGGNLTDPQSFNKYAYVQNNPYKYVDPNGEAACDVASELGGLAGLLAGGTADLLVAYGKIGVRDSEYIYLDALRESFDKFSTITGFCSVKGLGKKALANSITYLPKSNISKKVFSRAVFSKELDKIKETGFLRGGKSSANDPTYFTEGAFTNAKKAQRRLSLRGELRDYRVDFRIKNNPRIEGPFTVQPLPGKTGTGDGIEFFSTDPVEVEVINIRKLRKPR